jgi:hypothetical protein
MMVVAGVLAINAAVHALLVSRFGHERHFPFAFFGLIDAILAVAVFLAGRLALWPALALSTIGLVWLTVVFNRPGRDRRLDREIWITNLLIVLSSGYLLLAG